MRVAEIIYMLLCSRASCLCFVPFIAQNPPGNNDCSCRICQTCINWTVNNGLGGSQCVSSAATSYLILNTVQNASYNITVTYQAADGCDTSSDIFVNGEHKIIEHS